MLILSMREESSNQKRPAVVFLHSTNKNKEWLRPLLEVLMFDLYLFTFESLFLFRHNLVK